MSELNNARLQCFDYYVPVIDIEVVDTKQNVWKGTRIIEPTSPPKCMLIIFFSRRYDKDSGTDIILPEIHLHDAGIVGCEFWLIPKTKLLFGYDPPSAKILKPAVRPDGRRQLRI